MFGLEYTVGAYAIIWIFFFVYLASIGRKISRLEKKLDNLKK